uniref:Uncharacterized protein n=1 Tax=Schizaphis graminum TaxID=13262 RepID=A0A2S2PSL6_SCHGA
MAHAGHHTRIRNGGKCIGRCVCFSKELPSSFVAKSSRFVPQVTCPNYVLGLLFNSTTSRRLHRKYTSTQLHKKLRKKKKLRTGTAGRTRSHNAADGHGLQRQRDSSGRRRTDDRGRILQLSSTGGGANYRYMACLKGRRQDVQLYRQ